MHRPTRLATLLLALAVLAGTAAAKDVSFKDPTGDDNGPGNYVYPTDPVYKPGSFDLVGLDVKEKKDRVHFDVTVNSKLEDPWRMGTGFSVQNIFIFIDTEEGKGFTQGLPGLNITFAEDDAWDRCVILAPHNPARVKSEVDGKVAENMRASVLVPNRVQGSNRQIWGEVALADLGGGDPSTWGYQVVMQSNEGFPAATDLLTRKVNEYEGQHRFGGGNDADCDPHVMDVLAGSGEGDKSEVEAQHTMLQYECGPDGAPTKPAALTMVRKED